MNIVSNIPPVVLCFGAIIIVVVGAWYLYELGKERGKKGK